MNKNLLVVISLILSQLCWAQFVDNFTDSNYTVNPIWSGSNTNYEVDATFMLHLNAPAQTDTSYLSTPSESINNSIWEFYIQMDFNPSSSNYAKIYLVSDQSNLRSSLNGYFVKVGNTTDEISLYRQDGLIETEIIDGTDGRVNTASVASTIQVTRDSLGNWQLLSDTTGGTNFVLEGSNIDNTFTSSSFFGVSSRYTSTRATLFYFDNFNVNGTGFVDNFPPTLDSLIVINSTSIDVYFNEPIELLSAQTLTNYTVNLGIGNPSSVIRDLVDSSIVHLSFTTPFANGQNYNLTINSLEDTTSNVITTIIEPFTYLIIINPNLGDVVINEIFADPSPQIGLPPQEFIELYNTSTNTLALNNWQFINTTTGKMLPNYILNPDEYVILCDINDTALYSPFGNVIGVNSMTALTNGGDSLSLIDHNNEVIDIVKYDISWYQDNIKDDGGWSLERINPKHPCSSSNNWTSSINTLGGSPGTKNSVFDTLPDVINPTILAVNVVSISQIDVLFSEIMDSVSLANASYSFSGGMIVSGIAINSNLQSVTIMLSTVFDSSTVYTLTVNGGNDCSGNFLALNSIDFGIGKTPEKYEVVINELFPDPSPTMGLPTEDYLELYNNTNKIIDLTNCWISDITSMDQLNAGKILPGEYIIICDNSFENQFSPFGKVITVNNFPSLNNADDEITLYAPDTTLIHQVHYYDTWYKDDNKQDGGWSLEMIDPNNPCGEYDNWIASTKWFGGTPGTQNTAFSTNPDLVLPQLVGANAMNDTTVIISFNETIDELGMMIAIYSIDNGINIASMQIIDNKNLQLNLSNQLFFQIKYTVSVTGAFDCVGNIIGSDNTAIFALPEQGIYKDIVINEVLFNPFTGGSDFVEIYNNSNKFINIENWSLANFENDSIDNFKIITDKPKLLIPYEFMLLTKDAQNVANEYMDAVTASFLQMGSLPTYSNSEGNVYLINNLNMVVDSFNYNEDMHFALLNSFKGVSLERIDYNRPTNEVTNWHSAAEDVGFATPGYENSQYLKANNDGGDVVIDPITFSPDNDGVDDVVNISYNFPEPGYVANIIIYDAKGRLIKNLIQNELLGVSGTFSWDGITENNEKGRIGIYIIFIEAFDLSGNIESFKRTTVLAGHL
jgi:hypothetical protein